MLLLAEGMNLEKDGLACAVRSPDPTIITGRLEPFVRSIVPFTASGWGPG
jgi:hypothetical protein